jgi:hypothetical protein
MYVYYNHSTFLGIGNRNCRKADGTETFGRVRNAFQMLDFRWALPEYGIQTEPANVQSAEFYRSWRSAE